MRRILGLLLAAAIAVLILQPKPLSADGHCPVPSDAVLPMNDLRAPSELRVTTVRETSDGWEVSLAWRDNETAEECYVVTPNLMDMPSLDAGIWSRSFVLPASSAQYTHRIWFGESLPTIRYSVRAADRIRYSQFSAQVEASLPGAGAILGGERPPANGTGFGLFYFGGGRLHHLLLAVGCPREHAAFWATNPDGGFTTLVPKTMVTAVNQEWFARFGRYAVPRMAIIARCLPDP